MSDKDDDHFDDGLDPENDNYPDEDAYRDTYPISDLVVPASNDNLQRDVLLEGDDALQLEFMGRRFRECDRQFASERKSFLEQSFIGLKPVWDAIQAEQPVTVADAESMRTFLSHLDMGLEQGWFTLMDFEISPENFSFMCLSLSFYSRYAERLPTLFPRRFDFTLADWDQSAEGFVSLGLDPTQYKLSVFLKLHQALDTGVSVHCVLAIDSPSRTKVETQKGIFFSSSVPSGTVSERLQYLARIIFRQHAIHMCARAASWRVTGGEVGGTIDA